MLALRIEKLRFLEDPGLAKASPEDMKLPRVKQRYNASKHAKATHQISDHELR